MKRLMFLLAGIACGVASAAYLYLNYEPAAVQLPVHAVMFVAGYPLLYRLAPRSERRGWKPLGVYLAGALPPHLAIHATLIRDICCS